MRGGESNGVLYSYPLLPTKAVFYTLSLALAVAMLIWAGILILELLMLMLGAFSDGGNLLGAALFMTVFFGLFLVFFSNMYSDIRISDSGLGVKVFLFWWVFLGWDEVEEIRSGPLSLSGTRLIVVRRLTPFHRLIGLSAGWTLKPVIVIRRNLQGFHEAVRVVSEKIGESPIDNG
jgi:hypothetical protein